MKYSTLKLTALLFTLFSVQMFSQSVEILGEAKVSNMSNDNSIDDIVVRKSDGTLATRSAQSLPVSFADTTRNISSDLELAELLCECPNPPPFLIEQLLDSGYSAKDLQNAGVSVDDIALSMPIVDIDGNEYDQVKIGTQIWLSSNLRATQFNDGTDIDLVEDIDLWEDSFNDGKVAYCYPNGDSNNAENYGLIYNIHTIPLHSNKNICPIGFHVPDESEVMTLINHIDSDGTAFSNTAGSYLKETGNVYWSSGNNDANNITGFNGRGNGSRHVNSGSDYYAFQARNYILLNQLSGSNVKTAYSDRLNGRFRIIPQGNSLSNCAIRCLKD